MDKGNQDTGKNGHDKEKKPETALWSIAAVSNKTGLTPHVLRAWERRFGAPVPVRLRSGHRRYTQVQVEHLQLVARALSEGHRASDVVPRTTEQLNELLGVGLEPLLSAPPATPASQPDWLEQLLDAMKGFDRDTLFGILRRDASAMGVYPFLEQRVLPLLMEVGEAWHRGAIHIRHEHFMTDILQDLLRELRTAIKGPENEEGTVILCTLPNEQHGLGIQIVALLLRLHQWPMHILGVQTPVDEILATTESVKPVAVGVSVTAHTAGQDTEEMLATLSRKLPKQTALWVGGSGAGQLKLPPKAMRITNLSTLQEVLSQTPRSHH